MRKHKRKKIFAFIDSQNLNLGVQSQGWRLDFARFRVYLKDKYGVSKVFLFIGFIPKYKSLYTFLEKAGYTLIYKPVLESKKPHKPKGNVDAELVLHAMIEFPKYDKAIIVSGDGDFYCLIEYLLSKKKLERIIVPNYYKYSALLRRFGEDIDFLNSLKKKLEQKKEGH
ncbi:MAG: NYN domain-containing protein [Patescibacteria group bacterium]